jgi:predicted ATPase
MKLESLRFRNIRAYGNNFQELKFSELGSLNIIVGNNGFGKCVCPTTEIDVEILDSGIREEFEKYVIEYRK